jgi:hypothetical protein
MEPILKKIDVGYFSLATTDGMIALHPYPLTYGTLRLGGNRECEVLHIRRLNPKK